MTLYLISYLSYVYFPTSTLKQSENAIKISFASTLVIGCYQLDKKNEKPRESRTNSMVVVI